MVYQFENYMSNPNPECSDGDTFDRCNFAQKESHTPICVGKKNLLFLNCNAMRCDYPEDAIIVNGNNSQEPNPESN
jgi:hypothetical protein